MLHLVIGTMKASKSSTLIDYTNLVKPKKYTIFYPACCNKKDGYVVSRDNGKKAKAVKIFEVKDMYNYIEDTEVIFLDEFQFLAGTTDLNDLMNFLEYCDKKDKTVYMFGLSLNYMSQAFDVTQRVLPYADTIVVLTANCDICGKPATRCIRYVNGELDCNPNSKTLLMEGDTTEYKSVCKKCYRKLTGLNAIK